MGRSRDLADGTLAELNVDSNTLAVDATNNRVGIGTASPSYKLHSTTSDGSNIAGYFYNSAGSGNATALLVRGGANNSTPTFKVEDYGGNSDFEVTGTGNVGIGITPSSGKLHISPAPGTTSVRIDAGGTLSGARRNWGLSTEKYAAGAFSIESGTSEGAAPSVERMRIDSSGRVTMPYQPAFSAYLTSIQNITTTSPVKINYDNTIFNTGNHFDTTNNRFVAPIAGKYFFSVNHNFYDVAVGNHVRTQIYTNAVLSQQGGYIYSDSTSDQNITTVVILNLSANDYVEVFTQSSDASYGLSNAQQWNKFFGYLLG